jgi:hypothetical protein
MASSTWSGINVSASSCVCRKGYRSPRPDLPEIVSRWGPPTSQMLLLPAPQASLEIVKCGCKGKCYSSICSCMKNNLLCTSLWKCHDCHNTRDYNTNLGLEDEDNEKEDNIDNQWIGICYTNCRTHCTLSMVSPGMALETWAITL